MADNLTISIGADASRATAELQKLQAQIKETGNQLKAARQEFIKTGDSSGIDKLSKSLVGLRVNAAGAAQTARTLTQEAITASRAVVGLGSSMRAAATSVEGLGSRLPNATKVLAGLNEEMVSMGTSVLPGLATAFRALPAAIPVLAVAGLAKAINSVADAAKNNILETTDQAEATGFAVKSLEAYRRIAAETGVPLDALNRGLAITAENMGKARAATKDFAQSASGLTVMRGGVTPAGTGPGGAAVVPKTYFDQTVMKGGQHPVLDVTRGLEQFVDPARFRGMPDAQEQLLKAQAEALMKIKDASVRLEILRNDYGKMASKWAAFLAKLAEPGVFGVERALAEPTARQIEENKALAEQKQKADADLAAAQRKLTTTAGVAVMPMDIKTTEQTTAGLESADQKMISTGETWAKVTKEIDANWQTTAANISLGIPDVATTTVDFQSAWTGAIDTIAKYWASVVGAISRPSGEAALPPPIPPPSGGFASGGIVPGRGSGDTVPAWLTPGEFVVNARSARSYAPMLRSINAFRGAARFQDGGIIGAGAMVRATATPDRSDKWVWNYQDKDGFWHNRQGAYSTPEEAQKANDFYNKQADEAEKRGEQARRRFAQTHRYTSQGWEPAATPREMAEMRGEYARGGRVDGYGSGDTVAAWLTPGEFVNRTASVNYYGAGLFRALNARAIPRDLFSRIGFALGGLVGPQVSFAGGGSASSSAPVHLHLGGHSFALGGAPNVVDALVVEAHRQQIRSAGVKPSWFAGRPGGR